MAELTQVVLLVATGLVMIYWFAVIIALIAADREPTTTLAWLFVLIFLPFVGLLFYFVFGRNWKKITAEDAELQRIRARARNALKAVYERNSAFAERVWDEIDTPVAHEVITAIRRANAADVLPARDLEIFAAAGDKFARLEADLAAAERFIHLQYFIWEKDELTARIQRILRDRLAAGVEVRITYDYLGSILYSKSELRGLRNAGAHVEADITDLGRANYRNHRKIAVIDGEIGYTGGANMGQEYIDGGSRFPVWRDTHMRITGDIVGDLQKLFAARWLEIRGEDLLGAEYLPAGTQPRGSIPCQVVAQGVDDPWESARRAAMVGIGNARRSIFLQSPYFVPDAGTYDCLINAALGGIDVRLMMTGWPDKRVPFWAAQSYWKPILEAGARLYLYRPGFMHAKTMTIDTEVVSIGTLNFDVRSLRLHKELMVWIYDQEIARRHEAIFLNDLADCEEVTLEDIASFGRVRRFRNSAARLASNLL